MQILALCVVKDCMTLASSLIPFIIKPSSKHRFRKDFFTGLSSISVSPLDEMYTESEIRMFSEFSLDSQHFCLKRNISSMSFTSCHVHFIMVEIWNIDVEPPLVQTRQIHSNELKIWMFCSDRCTVESDWTFNKWQTFERKWSIIIVFIVHGFSELPVSVVFTQSFILITRWV